MNAIDTNILVRFLVNDDVAQGAIARRLFEKCEKQRKTLLVCTAILLELIWVLKSVYKFSRKKILLGLESLAALSVLRFEHTDVVTELIARGKKSAIELDDLLLGLLARESGAAKMLTFDKAAAKSGLHELLR